MSHSYIYKNEYLCVHNTMDLCTFIPSIIVLVVAVHVVLSEMRNVILAVSYHAYFCGIQPRHAFAEHDISTLSGVYVAAPFIVINILSIGLVLLVAVVAKPRRRRRSAYHVTVDTVAAAAA